MLTASSGGLRVEPRRVHLMDLIVTSEDNKYSLSRFRIHLWTVLILVGYAAQKCAKLQCADIPTNLWLLMGLNAATAFTATAITSPPSDPSKQRAAAPKAPAPDFIDDVFFETRTVGSLDLPRTQMFAWTIVTAVTYVALFVQQFPNISCSRAGAGPVCLLKVPLGMVALMGMSQGAYIGGKAADEHRTKTAAAASGGQP